VMAKDICASGVVTKTAFFTTGAPSAVGTTGSRYFATDQSGQIRQNNAAMKDMTEGQPLQ
jgi:hypothetical protein